MNVTGKTVIRGGRLLDAPAHAAPRADILIDGDNIAEIGRPGLAAPGDATVIDARGMLLHPGLVNAHTHGHGNLAKGMGDRWTLELLLASGPWTFGQRVFEDTYLSTLIGAVEMVLKGCTACYDLTLEMPMPTPEGLDAAGHAYADVGMRAVVAPMVADRTLYEGPSPASWTPSPRAFARTWRSCGWRPTAPASPTCARHCAAGRWTPI